MCFSSYTPPDLSPRQYLAGLASEANEIRKSVFMTALYDSVLLNDDHYIKAMSLLQQASQELLHMRPRASADLFSVLIERVPTLNALIERI